MALAAFWTDGDMKIQIKSTLKRLVAQMTKNIIISMYLKYCD
jgi:hypothetical protein